MIALKRCVNASKQTVLAEELSEAYSFVDRLRGLLWSEPITAGQGLLIKPCSSIHMIGMTYAIDVVFLDKTNHVVGIVEDIGPGQISPVFSKAACCIELPVSTIAATTTTLGDQIDILNR